MISFDKLRPWQKRFVAKFEAWIEENFLLVALPGGGKTFAALFAGKQWASKAVAKQRFLVVVVPSRNLRRQWQKEAKGKFGLELQTKEFDGTLKAGMNGCVVTYNAIASGAQLFRRLCAKYEVMVIFDEVHHAGESAAWGIALQEAFEGAVRRLSLSGTPWRSDGGKIPFLTPDEETGEYAYHERFDWPLALEEEPAAVRQLVFRPWHGFAEYDRGGELIRLSSHDKLCDDDVARCLRGRVLEQRFASDIIRHAHEKLLGLRETKTDAGGIVVCVDIEHAAKVAKWLEEITGEKPVLAVSDDDLAPGEPVEKFKASTGKWIVSVRQVSDGVDIPRLMVGVYLTNYTTELFFRQFIGRIARNQGTEFDKEAYVYYPHHPKLNDYAEKILELQAVAIANKGTDKKPEGPGTGPGPSSYTYLGGSDAEAAGIILPNLMDEAICGPAMERTISEYAKRYGIPETTAARILRDQQRGSSPKWPQDEDEEPATPASDEPLEDRLDRMRKAQNKRVGYWARLSARPYNHLNNEANEHVGCSAVEVATEEQLERRRLFIERKIREAKDVA